jgi:membrane associated rhomboid family serine protease
MQAIPARATAALAGITLFAWMLFDPDSLGGGAGLIGGFIPARFTAPGFSEQLHALVAGQALPFLVPAWLTPLSACLLHAGIFHLLFNLVMLGYCGKAVERVLGAGGIVWLYGAGAYAAALAQFLAGPDSVVPMVGASGAISAVVGAYSLLYGRQQPNTTHPRLGRFLHIIWLAIGWIAIQLLVGFASAQQGMAIAVAAHIGGFLLGLALAVPLLRWRYRKA